MTISSIQQCFHAMIPDVEITSTAEKVTVDMKVGDYTVLDNETYFVFKGKVKMTDLDLLLAPYMMMLMTGTLKITAYELDSDNNRTGVSASTTATVVYGNVDMDVSCAEFCNDHFLTLLDGTKPTALGRLEYLHAIGNVTATVTAYYDDGTTKDFTATKIAGNSGYSSFDVSPERYTAEGKNLIRYVVTSGNRTMEFEVGDDVTDCAPILLFTNCFGCQELLYCRGKHLVKPTYERSSATMGRKIRMYSLKETREFVANTGILTTAEMNWIDDLFRSKEIYVVNFIGGQPRVGREVIITDSKSEFDNLHDTLNTAEFTYRYAQRVHNVVQQRAGRVFDNTFDNTFD